MNAGWIKISRDIENHWLWTSAVHFQWWIDLLFMAAWEDRKVMDDGHLFVLERGKMIASVSFLSNRWKVSAPTVIKFLKLLEGENIIEREVLYRQTSIITICNYDRYQSFDYSSVYTQIDTQVNGIVYTNKENKEYKEENNYNNTHDKILKEVDEMKSDTIWKESICMNHKISFQKLEGCFDLFIQECKCKAIESHLNITEAKNHFHNWLRVYLKIEKENRNGQNRKPNPVENIDNAQQQAIRESMEVLNKTREGNKGVPELFPF